MMRSSTSSEAADELREQATSCRKLALKARTPSSSEALQTAAHQFDADAARIDPVERAASDDVGTGDAAALVRLREALERQSAQWIRPLRNLASD